MYPGTMVGYEILWEQVLKLLPPEALQEVENWSVLDQVSAITEARGRAMHRNAENNGLPTPESVRQIVLERLS